VPKKVQVKARRVSEADARALEAAAERRQRQPAAPTAAAAAPTDRRLVARKGRILADGSRTDAPPRLRLTVYVEPDLGRRLDVYVASVGRERSECIAEALAAWLAGKKGA
jgi:hypothetical protein